MKKYLFLIAGALLPYVLLAAIAIIYAGVLPTNISDTPSGFVIIALFLVYCYAAFMLNTAFVALCVTQGWNGRQTAKVNMIIKLAQVPAYVAIFVLGVLCFMTILTFMLSMFFILFDCFSVFLSGITGAAAAFRRCRESRTNLLLWFVLGALQFIFIADVICSVILFAANDGRETIELNSPQNNTILR